MTKLIRTLSSSMLALLVGACGAGASSPGPDPDPVRVDSGSPAPVSTDGWVAPPVTPGPADAGAAMPDQQAATQCPDLVGTWKGTIEGKANTYLQNVQMTGTVTMTVAAGSAPGEFQLTSLDVQAWSPLLPMFKVPLKTVGAQSFHCSSFNVAAPIEAQGKKGAGTITGQCSATECTGTFQGKTDDSTMDASGKFKVTKQ